MLNKTNQVTSFVEKIFELYHLNKYGFFYESDEDTFEQYEIPLFQSGEIDDATMNRLSIKLGLSLDEILSLDETVIYKYWNKYPFFELYDFFLEEWAWNAKYKEKLTAEEAFLYAIFNETFEIPAEKRYDYTSVKDRMITQLKELDAFMPGTFHPNATITNLTIETEVLFSFPQITEMLCSYIVMVETVERLFFKALKEHLTQDEINEYNFLVNALEITDIVMPSTLITYDNVCRYKQAYIEEGYNDFFSYAKIRTFVGTGVLCPGVDPWKCKEFFDNMELVNKLANIFPAIKEQMRKFAMKAKKFQCTFVWSDAKPITFSDEEEQDLLDCGMAIPLDERAKEPTIVYVDKTKEELFDWEVYIDRLSRATSPTAKGGLNVRPIDIHSLPPYSIKRMQRRVELKNGGNV